jgi:RNA polymerase-binding protein DksA
VKTTAAKTDPEKTTPETATPEKAPQKKAPVKAPARKTAAKKTGSARSAASTSAAKAPEGALAVKEGEEAWTKAELEEVLDELHEQRDHSVEILQQQESELTGLMRDSGDGAGHDQADMGATSFERDHELTVLNIEREKVAQIDRALARIENGTYGVCESCGHPIGKMRVMAFPRATLCLTCKQREERR